MLRKAADLSQNKEEQRSGLLGSAPISLDNYLSRAASVTSSICYLKKAYYREELENLIKALARGLTFYAFYVLVAELESITTGHSDILLRHPPLAFVQVSYSSELSLERY